MRKNLISGLLVVAISLGLSGVSARAGSYANNFNSDPTADPNFSLRPTAKWVPTGSHDGSGYISLTDAIASQTGTIVTPDIDGLGVTAFNLKMKVRIGGGTARPADGMSVTFADATDSIITGGVVGEEGPLTGLSINLDTYDNGNGDGPAIDIKVDNVIVAHKRFAGSGPQTTSPGPYCAPVERDGAGNPIAIGTGGAWTDLEINLSISGAVSVKYKGIDIFKDVPTGYGAKGVRSGRFVIGGRTGGATDNHWIDDLLITTDNSDSPPRLGPTLPAGNPGRDVSENSTIQFEIDASGTFYDLVQGSIRLSLDGADVTAGATITDDPIARITTVTYNHPTPFAPSSRHEAVLTYNDNNDPPNQGLGRKVFHVTPVVASTAQGTTLFIEAEDFNYTDGTSAGLFFDFGSPNGSYDTKAARHDTDYHLAASNADSPLYRVLAPPNGIVGIGDNNRAGVTISPDFKLGWNDPGDWYNYSRTFPNTTYKIYGRFSSGGADTHAQLSKVTSDPTAGGQTTQALGTFDGEATGGWDTFCFIPLRDASGNEVVVRLNGLTTLRVTAQPGSYDFNYLAFVPTSSASIPPAVVSVSPDPNVDSLRDPLIKAVIADADTRVVASSIRLFLDGTELTPVVQTDTAGGAEAQYQVSSSLSLAPGSTHTATVTFSDDSAVPVNYSSSWTFRAGEFKSGANTLFIEAEDFNFSDADGVNPGQHANFGDPDCSLLGKDATLDIDYHEGNNGNDQAVYRAPTGVEAGKPGTDGFVRGDHTITCSYIVGWNDPGDWYNYTRDFGPTARYNVYARLSSGGGPENAELARITSDPAATGQTKEVVGNFSSPATGNWDIFHTVPLRDGAGNLASVRLGGLTTLRFTTGPGNLDFNYLAFVKADVQVLTPSVESTYPAPNSDLARAPRITAAIKDEDTAVVASSLRLSFDGTDVTALSTVTDSSRGATISFQAPERSPLGTTHTVVVSWQDDQGTAGSFTWTYKEGIYNPEKNLFIEMEDFNTANGNYIPSSAGVPFNEKSLYNTLGATPDVDYHDSGDLQESNLYRTEGVGNVPHVNMIAPNDNIGGAPRPGFTTTPDYKIGWTDPGGDWYNYTRNYGAGSQFNVFLRGSHGDPAATIGGRLETVDDATSTTQTTTPLGNFRAPATGGWDTFTFIPLRTSDGSLATVTLSGVQTLRYSVEANGGDINFLMLCPVLVNACPTANSVSFAVDQGGSMSLPGLPASDPNGDYLQYTVTQPPSKGTLTVHPQTGAATYTAAANACGTDTFKFKVSDGECDSAEATVTITIRDTTRPQLTCPAPITAQEGTPVVITPPTGTDDCDGSLAATCVRSDDDLPLNAPYPLGTTTITCSVRDAGGNIASCSFTVTITPDNEPPVCVARLSPAECGVTFPSGTQLYAIAAVDGTACLKLDGSGSSDPDGDALSVSWVIDGTNVLSGTVVSNCLPAGCHTITMIVSDGQDRCHQFLDVCVITPEEAVEQLIQLVENTPLERKNKRPLLVSLKAAAAAFAREGWRPGAELLKVFQHKVRAQVERQNPAEAALFIEAAEKVLDALECSIQTSRTAGEND